LELAGKGGSGTLTGLGSSITGFATVAVDGDATWSLGALTVAKDTVLSNAGTLRLQGQVVNSGQITNLKWATLAFDGDYSITTDPAIKAGQFSNAGILQKLAGSGTSIIRTGTASLTSTSTIDVETGTLMLTGSTIGITGFIEGAGTIQFGPGNATLSGAASITTAGWTLAGAGTQVTVARNLGFGGAFAASIGTELTIDTGDLLKLTGAASFLRDTVDGGGVLATEGSTSVAIVTLGGTTRWFNTGTLTETGGILTIGDSAGHVATFNNQAGGVFDLAGNVNIAIGTGASLFENEGLLAKTAGGLSTIATKLTNTGTIEAASGTLDLQKGVSGPGGILTIDAGKAIQIDGAVSGQTVDFNGGGDKVVLTDATHVAGKLQDFGSEDKLDLRQFNPSTTTLAFSMKSDNSGGTLTATDGILTAKISLLGQYMASAFHKAPDGVGGTYVTYTPIAASALAISHS
jgi:hypothetical protein